MSKCLRCGATSEWIEGRVANEVATALESADAESDFLSAELAACQLDAERLNWYLTRERWPTEDDLRRGVLVASRASTGKWLFQDLGMQGLGTFALCNFGDPPEYWIHMESLAPRIDAARAQEAEA